MKSNLLILGLLAATFVAGCSHSSDQQSSAAPQVAVNQEASAGAPPPQALAEAGEYSENIYDMAKVSDWTQAAAKLALLKESVAKLKSAMPAPSLSQLASSLTALDKAVMAKDRKTTLREANQITLNVADLHATYKLEAPIEITKLDYYGRELEIWAAAKDNEKLRDTAASMRLAWDHVRPAVEAHNGSAEAAKFSALMAKVEAAKTAGDYGKLAGPVLDQVDSLEKVFHPGK